MKARRRHVFALAELTERFGDPERARNEHLAALDADTGLLVLQISDEEILAAVADRLEHSTRECRRCGARLAANRHRCSRCRLPRR